MGISAIRTTVITAVLTACLTGCVSAPETGRSQLLLISSEQEAELGYKAFRDLKRKTPTVRSGRERAQLQKVGRRIAAVAPMPYAEWEFVLFQDADANAFALPGGKVGVYTGILKVTKNEAGLATVIGHEVAHAVARHGAERMSHQLMIQVGGTALSAALGTDAGITRDLALQAYNIGTAVGVALPYSRTQELEADHLGLLYMARAGYDPREAIGFWSRFQEYGRSKGGRPPEFLSTHPLDSKRIAQLQLVLPLAMGEYERARARRGS